MDILGTTTIRDLLHWLPQRPLLQLLSNSSLYHAVNFLADNNVSAALIIDHDTGEYVGWLTLFDVLNAILQITATDERRAEFCLDKETLMHRGQRLGMKPLNAIHRSEKFIKVSSNGTLAQLVDEVFQEGTHRVVVLDEFDATQQKITAIVSQSDVISFLVKQRVQIPRTLKEVGLNYGPAVASMSINADLSQAFYVMYAAKAQGIALTSEQGELVGTLSVSDIKGLRFNQFHVLCAPIKTLLYGSLEGKLVQNHYWPRAPIMVGEDCTISYVIHMMVHYRVHRVFAIDTKNIPQRVITMTDILKTITQ